MKFPISNFQFPIAQSRSGFTLIELLVALAVFATLAAGTLGVYAFSLRAYQRSVDISRIQGEAALMVEAMAKKIRSSSIDYGWYGGTIDCPLYCQPVTALALNDLGGVSVFRANSGNLEVDAGNTGAFQPFNSQRVAVASLVFFIDPKQNPFSPQGASGQPRVILSLTVTPKGKSQPEIVIEQSIPQRLGI